jgi:hypothetical protein
MGIGSLAKLGISKGMSLGRELFGFLLRSDLNVAKIAEWAGVTLDTLESAPLEDLSAILERAARSGAIDPREANNINIQLAKDAQEAVQSICLTVAELTQTGQTLIVNSAVMIQTAPISSKVLNAHR